MSGRDAHGVVTCLSAIVSWWGRGSYEEGTMRALSHDAPKNFLHASSVLTKFCFRPVTTSSKRTADGIQASICLHFRGQSSESPIYSRNQPPLDFIEVRRPVVGYGLGPTIVDQKSAGNYCRGVVGHNKRMAIGSQYLR